MPKDFSGKRVNKILMPGDPGYNDPRLPWSWMRNVTGWQKPEAIQIPITGFFLIDRRANPPIAILKNMTIVGNNRKFGDEPMPFVSLDEAIHKKKSMNLSSSDELKVKIVALAPDPGMGNPHPNMIWVDKKTAKGM